MTPTQTPDQLASALAWVEANPADPRTPQVRAKIEQMRAGGNGGGSSAETPANQTASVPPRAPWKEYLDTFSDALPATGALVGGALATPPAVATGGIGAALIPAAGAAGYGAGEFAKRGIDKLSGRPGTPPPVDVLGSSARGASTAMNAFSGGAVMGNAAAGLKDAGSFASKLGSAPTQYAPLTDEMLGALTRRLGAGSTGPRDIVASTPVTSAERIGARYATPRVDAARGVGVRELRDLSTQAEGDVDLFRRGVGAERAIPNIEQAMRGNVTPMANASGRALDTVSRTLPAYGKLDAASEPPSIVPHEPGGNVVNNAFRNPATESSVIRSPEAMQDLADVKSLGLRNKVYGKALGKAHFDLANAEASGLTPGLAEERATDANTLGGISDSLQKQRGGVVQDKPTAGFVKTMLDKTGKLIAGPESSRLGTRAETPEAAMLAASRRQAEVEATRRGTGVPWSGDAYRAGARPLPAALASPNGRVLTGSEAELLRQYLAGGQQ